MCHANKKSWGHYKERKSTKAYWTALSNDIGIPISSLIIEIDGYGNSQGAWIHPEIAIDLAQWVSVEFRIWANRTLMKVIMGIESVQQQSMHDPSAITGCHSTTDGRARTAFVGARTATNSSTCKAQSS
ncbi:MAG: KilA-N domain-containing protein [Nostoc sp. LLA-1]|nr:KilA-N domain-containing protein [Cyanocohniella sp. LLY]